MNRAHDVVREFFTGFLKLHILYHASKEPIYGKQIIDELSRHGYNLSPGTLYPILNRLETQGYLRKKKKVQGGRMRIYYTTTPRGRKVLEDARDKIAELVTEIIFDK